ncbi:MAG: beta-propeller fold lactonase family protein, partial [Candidatus Rokubacteria bacterium]|nr:beta-propeller fold lactonase family protein [Candidatus Rokubacteria bacterium]
MRSRSHQVVVILGALLLWGSAWLGSGWWSASADKGNSPPEKAKSQAVRGEALVKERCAMCHPLGRVRSAQHTARGWQATVKTMKLFGLQVTDAETGAIVSYLRTAFPALGEDVSRARLYIPNEHDGTVSVVDTGSHAVVKTLAGIPRPHALCRSPDGRFVYVSNHSEAGGVQVIDTLIDGVVARIPTRAFPMHCAFSPEGRYVFVASHGANAVQIIDGIAREVIATIPAGQAPHNLVVSPDGRAIWVSNTGSSDLSVIDRTTLKLTATVGVGKAPLGLAMIPDGTRVYTGNTGSGDVSVIDAAALT